MDKETRAAQGLTKDDLLAMLDAGEDDFYEEDETPEEIDAAIRRSERGVTVGSKRLSPAGQQCVDAAAARYDTVAIRDCEFVSSDDSRWLLIAPFGSPGRFVNNYFAQGKT